MSVGNLIPNQHRQGWISNVFITHKNQNDKKISVNLDTRPMTSAVETSH